MTDIPEDIRKAAWEVANAWAKDLNADTASLVEGLSMAILAERERCARIAESDVPKDCSYGPGMGIARNIRDAAHPSTPTDTEKAAS